MNERYKKKEDEIYTGRYYLFPLERIDPIQKLNMMIGNGVSTRSLALSVGELLI